MGLIKHVLICHTTAITDIVVHPRFGNFIYTSGDNEIILWNIDNTKEPSLIKRWNLQQTIVTLKEKIIDYDSIIRERKLKIVSFLPLQRSIILLKISIETNKDSSNTSTSRN